MFQLNWLKEKIRFFWTVARRAEAIYALMARMHREQVFERELAVDKRVLAPYGFTAYSMADQDGILQEIFKRIGSTNRHIVEFGCGDGLENNTVYLVMTGWKAFWMDGGDAQTASVRQRHASRISSGQLQVKQTFITRENINELVKSSGLGPEIDLLVIDLDGNDYYVWEALTAVNPRVVVIEYNATFRPPAKIVQEYKADHVWDSTNFFVAQPRGASRSGGKEGLRAGGLQLAPASTRSSYARICSASTSPRRSPPSATTGLPCTTPMCGASASISGRLAPIGYSTNIGTRQIVWSFKTSCRAIGPGIVTNTTC